MLFTKRLRERIRAGEITCSVRIWMRPHVKVGARYRLDEGEIEIDSIEPIGFPDITPELSRESGFLGVLDLLKVAKHGKGQKIYLVRFHYVPRKAKARSRSGTSRSGTSPSVKPRTIDGYLATLSEDKRTVLEKLGRTPSSRPCAKVSQGSDRGECDD